LDKGDQTPDQTPGPQTPNTTPTPEQPEPQDGGTPDEGGSTEPQPHPHPDHAPDQNKPETTEPDTGDETDTNPGGEEQQDTGGHDPDEEQGGSDQTTETQKEKAEREAKEAIDKTQTQQQPQPQGPQAGPEQPAPGEVKIGPDQMKDKWVSQVYDEQLGDGSQAEMLSNAQEAINSGEIEAVKNPNGTFYYKLTEAGAAKLPGAGTGSSTTYDVMRILASHSDKIDVA
jgi:hypothetical protein